MAAARSNTSYCARSLSDDLRVSVRVDCRSRQIASRPRILLPPHRPNDMAPAQAVLYAGKTMCMEVISPVLGQATDWPMFRGGQERTIF